MSQTAALQSPIDQLLDIMARLRDPATGCPWDLEQSFETIAPYTVEEAYEVADAVQRGALRDLKEELGDLLFQVVFHARLAEELGEFSFQDVAKAICEKMTRRHPHVFAHEGRRSSAEQTQAWEDMKTLERAAKGDKGVLDDVPVGMPGLTRAVKLSKRAARVGFVWRTTEDVLAKVHEELAELEEEIKRGDRQRQREELGDLLFVCANLARDLEIDPEDALRLANAKFVRRFNFVASALRDTGETLEGSTLEEMGRLWNIIRAQEKAHGSRGP